MGERFEKSRKDVTENRESFASIERDKDILSREFAPLAGLSELSALLDDEVAEAVDRVSVAGEENSQRLEQETEQTEKQRDQIAENIDRELEKLRAGMDKLQEMGQIGFGAGAIDRGMGEYAKQSERFRQLLEELGVSAGDQRPAGSAGGAGGGMEGAGRFFDLDQIRQLEDPDGAGTDAAPVAAARLTARQLSKTMQTIRVVVNADGTRSKVFDHPEALAPKLAYSQGNNSLGKSGTCGLADTAQWLSIAGTNYTENDVVKFASDNGLCSASGGTAASDRAKIWAAFGMPAEVSYDVKISALAEDVESGRAVAVGVNAGLLWSQDNPEGYDYSPYVGDGGSNHVVGIMSVRRDPVTDAIEGFYINDTGRGSGGITRDGCRFVPLADFEKAFRVPRASACVSREPVW